jgi:NADPH:quinone reductase-like Zn-dependent oxidoreductase
MPRPSSKRQASHHEEQWKKNYSLGRPDRASVAQLDVSTPSVAESAQSSNQSSRVPVREVQVIHKAKKHPNVSLQQPAGTSSFEPFAPWGAPTGVFHIPPSPTWDNVNLDEDDRDQSDHQHTQRHDNSRASRDHSPLPTRASKANRQNPKHQFHSVCDSNQRLHADSSAPVSLIPLKTRAPTTASARTKQEESLLSSLLGSFEKLSPWDSSPLSSAPDLFSAKRPSPPEGLDQVVVLVQAFVLCRGRRITLGDQIGKMDHCERSNIFEPISVPDEPAEVTSRNSSEAFDSYQVNENNFVGVVQHSEPAGKIAGVKPGMKVTTLLVLGRFDEKGRTLADMFIHDHVSARYVTLSYKDIVLLPKHIDPPEAATVVTTYLPAFLALHHGRPLPRANRYCRQCLQDRKVLVVSDNGVCTPIVQAALRLAHFAGCRQLFVVAARKNWERISEFPIFSTTTLVDAAHFDKGLVRNHVNIHGSYRASDHMDLIVDFSYPHNIDAALSFLSSSGTLVCVSPRSHRYHQHEPSACSASALSTMESAASKLWNLFEQTKLSLVDQNVSLFDLKYELLHNYHHVRSDFEFLVEALSKRQIRPSLHQLVTLAESSQAYSNLLCQGGESVVCEPWR